MRAYKKSITEYQEVRSAMDCAREEGREEGTIFVIRRCLQKNMPIDDIIDLTGFSKEQIIRYMENAAQ